MPRELDTSKLQQFTPRNSRSDIETPQKPIKMQMDVVGQQNANPPEPEAWPSRESPKEGQFTIRAPLVTINRFRQMCKDDRRTYANMLGILMDTFDGN